MKKAINYIIVLGMAALAFSCTDPEEFTAAKNKPYGDWEVQQYYVDGQNNGNSILERFTLERDGSFLLEDENGVLFYGTWESTDTSLTLTEAGESTQIFQFEIVFLGPEKMQLLQSIEGLDLEIRYLMNWQNADEY
ncbi:MULTISPECIES: hypothetical protein [Reichenbachiella]|uniref:Lipocalin-like domain-containing protein n=1 Tax=Reichenbachiella agariperforans TaxID=156994 RepID=A0A1M6JKD9_REIAG|nr:MULTISPECIES: hypothetical protein [Reichenbachiella]RJE74776.1 hypothetical protein BGP76_16725 [Reichenbachiella sp. MSK19-1]SHJ47115.1 hypothetical protein SAMN04488028_101226 [Reichenbachiella agariperforans]